MNKLIATIFIALAAGGIGFFIGNSYNNGGQLYPKVKIMRTSQNGLINPLLEYEVSQDLFSSELKIFKDDIQKTVDNMKQEGKADKIAVYFRSLNDGPWFGIDEDENFFPASLLKVPIMIAYFKQAETNPEILKKEIKYEETDKNNFGNNAEFFKGEKSIEAGKTYTVDELIKYMILYSDNNAKNLLLLHINDVNDLIKVYTDLGIASAIEAKSSDEVLSVHDYATVYRVLYNASYLSKEMSKKALGLLVEAKFPYGLSAGLPDNIKLANKFGEYQTDTFKQLHDCGIVYYPSRPYIICVMTRGNKFEDLEQVLRNISKLVYEEVDKQVKNKNND